MYGKRPSKCTDQVVGGCGGDGPATSLLKFLESWHPVVLMLTSQMGSRIFALRQNRKGDGVSCNLAFDGNSDSTLVTKQYTAAVIGEPVSSST
jgi:hypothetical protein